MDKRKGQLSIEKDLNLSSLPTGVSTAELIYSTLVDARDSTLKDVFIHYTNWLKDSNQEELGLAAESWSTFNQIEGFLDDLAIDAFHVAEANYWATLSDNDFRGFNDHWTGNKVTERFLKAIQKTEVSNGN